MNKKLALVVLSATALYSPHAHAENYLKLPGTFDSYMTLVSDYSFRGISQSGENPAIQGSLTWTHDSGAYLGFWASSVDFGDASTELDLYAGYSKEFVKHATVDIGLLYYAYPGAEDSNNYNYWEAYGSLAYDFDVAKVKAAVNYSPDFALDSGDATYISATVEVPLPYNFGFSARIGRQYVQDNAAFALPDYTDWEIAINYQVMKDLKLNLSYVDTDLDKTECPDGCDAKLIAGVSASF
ncbi:MAG: hypothetical protein EB060_02225 [Proteobacteria bacterium]|nr:hypothetical protein [Pseudomonadota bacterium]